MSVNLDSLYTIRPIFKETLLSKINFESVFIKLEIMFRLQMLNFCAFLIFSDPEPGFDRSQVYGVAAKLFKIKDMRFAVALDTAGGGKVSQIQD